MREGDRKGGGEGWREGREMKTFEIRKVMQMTAKILIIRISSVSEMCREILHSWETSEFEGCTTANPTNISPLKQLTTLHQN